VSLAFADKVEFDVLLEELTRTSPFTRSGVFVSSSELVPLLGSAAGSGTRRRRPADEI
jgi:hypothetical protein